MMFNYNTQTNNLIFLNKLFRKGIVKPDYFYSISFSPGSIKLQGDNKPFIFEKINSSKIINEFVWHEENGWYNSQTEIKIDIDFEVCTFTLDITLT